MADAFDDLAALAAKGDDPTVAPSLVKTNGRWSYPGCPLDGGNLRLPRENLPDARVLAALADGAWTVIQVDANEAPLVVAPAGKADKRPLTLAQVGTAAAVPSFKPAR